MSCVRIALISMGLLGVLSMMAYAQRTDRVLPSERQLVEQTLQGLETGNPERVLVYARGSIRIALVGAQTLYSPAQARYVLRAFFEEHPPADVVLVREFRRQGHLFVISRLITKKRETFRVYVRFSRDRKGWSFRELRIDAAP